MKHLLAQSFAIIFISLLTLTSCRKEVETTPTEISLIGKWKNTKSEEQHLKDGLVEEIFYENFPTAYYSFYSNGNLTITDEGLKTEGSWEKVNEKMIKITIEGETTDVEYILGAGSMVMKSSAQEDDYKINYKISFTRVN